MEAFKKIKAELAPDAGRAAVTHAVAAVAAAQHGAIAGWQLRELTLDRRAINKRVDAGTLFPAGLARDIFKCDARPLTPSGRRWAGLLWAPPGSALSHSTAAVALDLEPLRGALVHLVTHNDSPHRALAKDVKLHRTSLLPTHDLLDVDGTLCTAFARTLLDVASADATARATRARSFPRSVSSNGSPRSPGFNDSASSNDADRLDRLLERGEQLRIYDQNSLDRVLTEHPNVHGGPPLRAAIGRVDANIGRSRSWFEILTVRLIAASKVLPTPVLNATVEGVEPDIWFVGTRAIIEADSRMFHRTSAQIARDAEKEAILIAAGYVILRLRWEHVAHFALETLPRLEAFYRDNAVPPVPGVSGELVVW